MNKPKWENAPKWANYLAMDGDGQWYWYENEPYTLDDDGAWSFNNGKFYMAISDHSDWANSLERRPND